jgi:hypothetical protein
MFSGLRTRKHRRQEGSGLYKQIERDNNRNIAESRAKVDKYKADAEKSISNFEKKMEDYQKDLAMGRAVKKPAAPKLSPVPEISAAEKIPDDLSLYVDFLHPWGSRTLDLGVLVAMFFTCLIGTVVALRVQDV